MFAWLPLLRAHTDGPAEAGRRCCGPDAPAGFYDLGHGAVLGYFPRALEHLARLLPALMGLPWQVSSRGPPPLPRGVPWARV